MLAWLLWGRSQLQTVGDWCFVWYQTYSSKTDPGAAQVKLSFGVWKALFVVFYLRVKPMADCADWGLKIGIQKTNQEEVQHVLSPKHLSAQSLRVLSLCDRYSLVLFKILWNSLVRCCYAMCFIVTVCLFFVFFFYPELILMPKHIFVVFFSVICFCDLWHQIFI